ADPYLAQVAERGRENLALPAQVGIAVGIALLEVTAGLADVGERTDLRLGHERPREQRRLGDALIAIDERERLHVQPEEADEREPEHRDRDQDLEEREA